MPPVQNGDVNWQAQIVYYVSNVLAAAPIAIQDYSSLATDAGDSEDYLSLDLALEYCA